MTRSIHEFEATEVSERLKHNASAERASNGSKKSPSGLSGPCETLIQYLFPPLREFSKDLHDGKYVNLLKKSQSAQEII